MNILLKNLYSKFSKLFFIIINYKEIKNINNINCKFSESVVIANGPSLKSNLLNNIDSFKNKNLFCVNNFAESEFYEVLKPTFYIITDPIYWDEIYVNKFQEIKYTKTKENIDDLYRKYLEDTNLIRNKFINSFATKTTWNIYLFLPILAKKSKLIKELQSLNNKIKIIFYSTIPINFRIKRIRHFFYDNFIGMPTPQSVVIPAITISLWLRPKKIYLFGCDHSMHKEIFIDNNNKLFMKNLHFYTTKNYPLPIPHITNLENKETTKVHEFFYILYILFRSHFFLNEYSRFRKSKIINMTSESFVDSYDRFEKN